MAPVQTPGGLSGTIESLARATDGFFRDPSTGNVVLVETPNTQMKALGLALGASRLLRRARVVEAGDPAHIFLERAAMALLIWWSVHEIQHGTTKYLKTIGALTLVGAVARTILADPKYGLSPAPERIPSRANN
jgi:hypothetical protein